MKYLITGLTGFAGPHLARLLLDRNHEVDGIVRTANGREQDLLDILLPEELDRIGIHRLDLKHYYSVQKILNEQCYDGIFHLAAQSHPPTSFHDPILTFEENVNATVNLTTALEGMDTKIMVCSTSEVYGNRAGGQATVQEDAELSPSNPYGVSKAAVDLHMQERMANEKVIGFVTRAFSHTGPRRGRIFSISSDAYQIAMMMCGSDSRTLRVGNLNTERVVIDVRDCVNAYYLLMINKLSAGNVYNICGDVLRKMSFFTDHLIEISGLEIEKTIDSNFYRPIDIQSQNGDSTKLQELTLWKPEIAIEQTLEDLLQYWINKISINQK